MHDATNILISIDAESILKAYENPSQSPDKPTLVDGKYVYAVAASADGITGEVKDVVKVAVSVGDEIRWREVSLSLSFAYSVVFYNLKTSDVPGEQRGARLVLSPPVLKGGIETEEGFFPPQKKAIVSQTKTPTPIQTTPPNTPPWDAKVEETPYYYWMTQVTEAGRRSDVLQWQFTIRDQRGALQGYFAWNVEVMNRSEIIDILVAIDAETIMANYPNGGGTEAKPTLLDANKYFYMVVKTASVVSGNAGGELDVSANIGDVIRWREVSLSVNFEYGVAFAGFRASSGGANIQLPPSLIGGVSGQTVYQVKTPMPKQTSPPNSPPWGDVDKDAPYHFWQSTAMAAGKVTYQWVFQIFDQAGTSKGYFGWDPFISISDPG